MIDVKSLPLNSVAKSKYYFARLFLVSIKVGPTLVMVSVSTVIGRRELWIYKITGSLFMTKNSITGSFIFRSEISP